jgi:hypothetical protein
MINCAGTTGKVEYRTMGVICDGGVSITSNNIPFCLSPTCLPSDLDAAVEATISAFTVVYEALGVPCSMNSAAIHANWTTVMFLLTVLVGYISSF